MSLSLYKHKETGQIYRIIERLNMKIGTNANSLWKPAILYMAACPSESEVKYVRPEDEFHELFVKHESALGFDLESLLEKGGCIFTSSTRTERIVKDLLDAMIKAGWRKI